MIFLAEIKAWDPAQSAEVTLRYGTVGFTTAPGDSPANAHFEERITQPALLSRNLFARGTTMGASEVGVGDLELVNSDGALDDLIEYGFDGRDVRLYAADRPTTGLPAWGDFTQVLRVTMEQAVFDTDRVRIKLRDRQALTDVPLQDEHYAGDNDLPSGLEGTPEDLEGQPKPIVYGKVKNIALPLVNSALLIYQVSCAPVEDITAVKDRGLPLGVGLESWQTLTFPGSEIIEFAAGNGVLIATADSEGVYRSTDNGDTWALASTNPTDGSASMVTAAVFAEDLFVVGGQDGSGNTVIFTSTDGDTWVERTISTTDGGWVRSFTRGDGLFVGTNLQNIFTSPDGITWTEQHTLTAPADVEGLAYGAGRFVGVGNDTVLTSTNGTSWSSTGVDGIPTDNREHVTFVNRRFVTSTTGTPFISTSRDGLTWTTRGPEFNGLDDTGEANPGLRNGVFVQGRYLFRSAHYFAVSRDADLWEVLAAPSSLLVTTIIRDIIHVDGRVIVGTENGDLFHLTTASEYSDLSELQDPDDAPERGTYKWVSTNDGTYVRLGSPPDGIITADVTEGASASDRTAGQVFVRILERLDFSAGDWSASDITALDTANDAEIGYWSGTREVRASEVLSQVASSVGAWWGVDSDGVFRIQRFEDPAGEAADLTILEDDVMLGSLKRLATTDPGAGIPKHRVVVRYAKNWNVQPDDLAAAVEDSDRAFLASEWRSEAAEDASVLAAHPLSGEQVDDTLLVSQADAEAEADRRLALRGVRRDRIEVSVPYDEERLALDLGDVVAFRHSRLGIFREFELLELDVDGSEIHVSDDATTPAYIEEVGGELVVSESEPAEPLFVVDDGSGSVLISDTGEAPVSTFAVLSMTPDGARKRLRLGLWR